MVNLLESGVARPVTLNRFTNVAVHDDEYKICCGTIGACTATCSKRVKQLQTRTGKRAPKHLPPAVKAAKEACAQAILTACAPHIIGGKIGDTKCRRAMCHEWLTNVRGKGPRRNHAKIMLPGMACSERCTAFPCVAKLAGAAFPACQAAIGEFNALAAVQAWRAQPAEATEAGTSGATGGAADEGGSGMQVEA